MSANTIGLFKKGINHKQPSKMNDNQLFSMKNNALPKKLDYSKVADYKKEVISPPENVILNLATNLKEENKTIESKFNSPRVTNFDKSTSNYQKNACTPKLMSSSNLPTANNSFYTISSPEHDKLNNFNMDEYAGLCANQSYCLKTSQDRKISAPIFRNGTDSLDSVDGVVLDAASPDLSIYNNISSNKKKSQDFKVKFKTEICKFWSIDGTCNFGDNCAFAHGSNDLRKKSSVTTAYRTRNCKQFFESGFCPYGKRCQFAHSLGRSSSFSYSFSYRKTLNQVLRSEDLENLKTSLNSRNRLPVFNKLSCSRANSLFPDFLEEIIKIKNSLKNNNNNNEKYSSIYHDKTENKISETHLITDPQLPNSGAYLNKNQTSTCNFNRLSSPLSYNLK